MSNAINPITNVRSLLDSIPAANDDRIGENFGEKAVVATAQTSTGWDAYEVWRRFIKEARDRRRSED